MSTKNQSGGAKPASADLPPAATSGPDLSHPAVQALVEEALANARNEITALKQKLAEVQAPSEREVALKTSVDALNAQVESLKAQLSKAPAPIGAVGEDPEVMKLAKEKMEVNGLPKETALEVARRQVAHDRKKAAEAAAAQKG